MTKIVKKKPKKSDEFLDGGEIIVQHNKLIEARYRLSLQEKRMMYWLASRLHSDDVDFKDYRLDIKDFGRMAEIRNNKLYDEVMKTTEKLMKRVMKIREIESNRIIQVSWLSSAEYLNNEGCVLLCFDPKLKLYLLNLKQEFTKLSLADLLELKSIYSIRMFELLVQYESIGKRKISIKDLREFCGIKEKEYTDYFDMKRKVIERAKREINEKTNYKIDYTEIKSSRRVVSIEWTIRKETHFEKDQSEKGSIIQKEMRSANALIEGIMEFGFSKAAAKRFLQKDSEETVRKALRSVNIQIERGHVKNAKAMLVVAVNEKWDPEVFVDKKAKRDKEPHSITLESTEYRHN